MRVRPFFWLLLAVACMSVLCVAFLTPTHTPVQLQVHVDADTQHPVSLGVSSLKLHLTDTEGLPIEQAQIISHAYMTNMDMLGDAHFVRHQGPGDYMVAVHFSMSGPWAITIQAVADGFAPSQQTLFLQVASSSAMMYGVSPT